MFAVVSEVLSHGAASVGGQVLQGSSVGGGGRDHDGVPHGISICEPLHQLSYSGPLLTNSNIDTIQLLLLFRSVIEALLIDDGVDGNSGFAAGEMYKANTVFRIFYVC